MFDTYCHLFAWVAALYTVVLCVCRVYYAKDTPSKIVTVMALYAVHYALLLMYYYPDDQKLYGFTHETGRLPALELIPACGGFLVMILASIIKREANERRTGEAPRKIEPVELSAFAFLLLVTLPGVISLVARFTSSVLPWVDLEFAPVSTEIIGFFFIAGGFWSVHFAIKELYQESKHLALVSTITGAICIFYSAAELADMTRYCLGAIHRYDVYYSTHGKTLLALSPMDDSLLIIFGILKITFASFFLPFLQWSPLWELDPATGQRTCTDTTWPFWKFAHNFHDWAKGRFFNSDTTHSKLIINQDQIGEVKVSSTESANASNRPQESQEAIPSGSTVTHIYNITYAQAVGPNARSEGDQNIHSLPQIEKKTVDLEVLSQQLSDLLPALRQKATDSKHDEDIVDVGKAKNAAKSGDGDKAMSHLAKVGEWVFDVAKEMTAKIAAETIAIAIHHPLY